MPEQARTLAWLYWWLAFPRTAFGAWCKVNGGARAEDNPEGDRAGGPAWEKEGIDQATYAAKLFVEVGDHCSLPTAGNPAPDGRYPAAYELKCWRWVLARPDVLLAPLGTCPCGPPAGTATEEAQGEVSRAAQALSFYRKRTWLATCVRELIQAAAHCSGAGQEHQHATLAGRPRGSNVGSCRAAGE